MTLQYQLGIRLILLFLINLYPSLMKQSLLYFLFFSALFMSCNRNSPVRLQNGMTLTNSVTIAEAIYQLPAAGGLDKPVLLVKGENIILDFNGATLDSGMVRRR